MEEQAVTEEVVKKRMGRPKKIVTEGAEDVVVNAPSTEAVVKTKDKPEIKTKSDFVDKIIIPKLEARGLVVRKGLDKPYLMADGRLMALHMLYPNPIELIIEDKLEQDTATHFIVATYIKLIYRDKSGNICTKVGRGISAISKKSTNEFERSAPIETAATSSLGRALKNLGILSEWGPTADEIIKSKNDAKADRRSPVTEIDAGVPTEERPQVVDRRLITQQQQVAIKNLAVGKGIDAQVADTYVSSDITFDSAAEMITLIQKNEASVILAKMEGA